ncbi:MAG: hypothetical protein BroJett029_26200 [Alphaproteobacteria bacterium]|nr:MAG: hypothetical protein BroJett029_26200 [Alphaproteobacteria bacterium]
MSFLGFGDLAVGLGLVLVIEGVLLALLPETLKRMVAAIVTQPVDSLRIGGVVSVLIGVGIVWLVRG